MLLTYNKKRILIKKFIILNAIREANGETEAMIVGNKQ